MAITKIQSESLNLADDYTFTGTIAGAGESNTPAFVSYVGSNQSISDRTNTKVNFKVKNILGQEKEIEQENLTLWRQEEGTEFSLSFSYEF